MLPKRPLVRPATDQDLRKIADEYVDKGTNPLNLFSTLDRLKQLPGQGLLIAEIDGAFTGFLYWFSATETRIENGVDTYAHIVEVKVRKEF